MSTLPAALAAAAIAAVMIYSQPEALGLRGDPGESFGRNIGAITHVFVVIRTRVVYVFVHAPGRNSVPVKDVVLDLPRCTLGT